MTANVTDFVDLALAQTGDRYVFGAEASASDPDPDTFDCSELIQWCADRLDVRPRMPDGSWNQAAHCRDEGTLISPAAGLQLRGALLFYFSSSPFVGTRPSRAHVAISLGDGRTMEARSAAAGVGVFGNAASRTWTQAARVPGLDYGPRLLDWQAAVRDWVVAKGISNGADPLGPARRVDVWDAVRDLHRIITGE